MIRRSFFVPLFLSVAASAQATEIVTEEGALQGKIIGKEASEIFFETDSGIVNIRKSDILSIDGKPYVYTPPKPAAAIPASSAPTPQAETPQADSMPVYPEGVTEEELKAYYSAHPEEFREPLKVRVLSLGQAFFTRSESEIRSDPTSQGNWRDAGWIEEGQTVEPFEEPVLRKIFDLSVGGVSPLLKDKYGVGYLLRVVERKESAIPPYEEARPEVLNKILQSRT